MAPGSYSRRTWWLLAVCCVLLLSGGCSAARHLQQEVPATPWQSISNTPGLEILSSLVRAASLTETLDQPDLNYTLFLPNNVSFADLATEQGITIGTLLNSSDLLQSVLLYHVYTSGSLAPDSLTAGTVLMMANNVTLKIVNTSHLGIPLAFRDAMGRLVTPAGPPMRLGDSILYTLTSVLLPIAPTTIAEALYYETSMSTTSSLLTFMTLQEAGFNETDRFFTNLLDSNTTNVTFLVPTDDAFASRCVNLTVLLSDPDYLNQTLRAHIIQGSGDFVPTTFNDTVLPTQTPDANFATVNQTYVFGTVVMQGSDLNTSALITSPDLVAGYSKIYAINNVLFPDLPGAPAFECPPASVPPTYYSDTDTLPVYILPVLQPPPESPPAPPPPAAPLAPPPPSPPPPRPPPDFVVRFAPVLKFGTYSGDGGPLGVPPPATNGYPMTAQTYYDAGCVQSNCDMTEWLSKPRDPNAHVYFAVQTCGSQVRIKYHFFYAWQPPCINNDIKVAGAHQADWESVTVILSEDQTRVAAVTYEQHGGWYTRMAGDDGFSLEDGRPVVYIAETSHGCYYNANTDVTPLTACAYFGDYRSDDISWNTGNVPLIDLLAPDAEVAESWILQTRTTGEIIWAPWDGGDTLISLKSSSFQAVCDGDAAKACTGVTYDLTADLGLGVDPAGNGCSDSQCLTGWKDAGPAGCTRCPDDYFDCGAYCARGSSAWDCAGGLITSIFGSGDVTDRELENYDFILPQTDAGLL